MTFMRGPRLRRLSVILAIAGLAAAGISGCSSGSSASSANSAGTTSNQGNLTTITVDALPDDAMAGLWIAKQDGYFKQQGLNVNIVLASGSAAEFTNLESHTADFASGNYVTLLQTVEKDPSAELRIVADDVRAGTNTVDLMVTGNSKITSVAQLKGKSIAFTSPGLSSPSIALDEQLAGYGLGASSYTIVPMGFPEMAAALKSGEVSAAFETEPYITEMETNDGDHPLTDLMAGGMHTFPLEGWFSTESFVKSDPQAVAGFQRAIAKGQSVALADPALVRKVMTQYIPNLSAKVAAVMNLRTYNTTVTVTQLDRVVAAMQQLGGLPKNFNVAPLLIPLPSGA